MAKVFGINTKIRGKVGEYIYRQTKVGTVVSEAPVKPITPLRTQSQMNIRTQWANLGVVKVYITKRMKLNGGAILAPYQITRGSLPSISMTKNSNNKLVSSIALGSLTISATTTVAQFSQAVIDNSRLDGVTLNLTWRPRKFMNIRLYAGCGEGWYRMQIRPGEWVEDQIFGYNIRLNMNA